MEVKIDKSTLPKDGQKVKFKLFHDIVKEGVYVEAEQLFYCSEREFYTEWIVLEWEPIN